MKSSRRSFLQSVAAVCSMIPFAGQLFAHEPPREPKIPPRQITMSDVLTRAEHVYLTDPAWHHRVNRATYLLFEKHDARRLRPSVFCAIRDVLVYSNAFPYIRLNGEVGLLSPREVELVFDPATAQVDVRMQQFPQLELIASGPAAHLRFRPAQLRLDPKLAGLNTYGWSSPSYWLPEKQQMPCVDTMIARFEKNTAKALQRFLERDNSIRA